ncbi:hypothetical protein KM043_000222 [Ampulex compressa]|nr:hypothetical protein KM043_000222 [Ampulex compressa]
MSKVEINNEIVLMRHSVRQARVCTVSKLVREAKRLREKRGDEKQREKNGRKAERLLREVSALKSIKDDAIARFAITNYGKSGDILRQSGVKDDMRIMAKIVQHRRLNEKIRVFVQQFPDYENFLSKPKRSKPKRDSTTKNRTPKKSVQIPSDDGDKTMSGKTCDETNEECLGTHTNCKKVLQSRDICGNDEDNDGKDDGSSDNGLMAVKDIPVTLERLKITKRTAMERKKKPLVSPKGLVHSDKPKQIRIVNEQATVKRLADILQEPEENQEDLGSIERGGANNCASSRVVKADDFFVSSNESCISVSREDMAEVFRRRDSIGRLRPPAARDQSFANQRRVNRYGNKACPGRTVECRNNVNPNEGGPVDVDNDSRLHPSWMARKKERDIMKQGFQGTKIIFAED